MPLLKEILFENEEESESIIKTSQIEEAIRRYAKSVNIEEIIKIEIKGYIRQQIQKFLSSDLCKNMKDDIDILIDKAIKNMVLKTGV